MINDKFTFEDAVGALDKLYKLENPDPRYSYVRYWLKDKDGFVLSDIYEALSDLEDGDFYDNWYDYTTDHGLCYDTEEEAQEWYNDYVAAYEHLVNDLHLTKDNAPSETEFLKLYCDDKTQAAYKAYCVQHGLIDSWDDDYKW